MIILDTNIISELMKASPNQGLWHWFETIESQPLFLTAITVAELRYGVCVLPEGKRRDQLDQAITQIVEDDFLDQILDFNQASAEGYGILVAKLRSEGITMSQSDAMIASMALAYEATLITRNVKDFEHCGIELVNPFT